MADPQYFQSNLPAKQLVDYIMAQKSHLQDPQQLQPYVNPELADQPMGPTYPVGPRQDLRTPPEQDPFRDIQIKSAIRNLTTPSEETVGGRLIKNIQDTLAASPDLGFTPIATQVLTPGAFPSTLGKIIGRISTAPPGPIDDLNVMYKVAQELNPTLGTRGNIKFANIPDPGLRGFHFAEPTNFDPSVSAWPKKSLFERSGLVHNIVINNPRSQTAEEIFDTLMHEGVHTHQSTMDPFRMSSTYIPSSEAEAVRESLLGPGMSGPIPLHATYRGQNIERQAFRAGSAAVEKLRKFGDYFDKFDVNQLPRNAPDFINEVIIPAFNDRAAAIEQRMIRYQNDPIMMQLLEQGSDNLMQDILALQNNQGKIGEFLPLLDEVIPGRNISTLPQHNYINKYLNKFLTDRLYSGTSPIQLPGLGSSGPLILPGPRSNIADILRKIAGRQAP